jgi:serine/threonine protein kinase
MMYVGPSLAFYGCVWNGGRIRVDPLTHTFDLSTHRTYKASRHNIASSLDAFLAAVATIKDHYRAIKTQVHANNMQHKVYNPGLPYPYVTSYQDEDGRQVTFVYKARLDRTKLVFEASANQPHYGKFVVKFTLQYSKDAHSYLASRGWAPRLRQCSELPGGWVAIFMDFSDYKALFEISITLSSEQKEKVRSKVKKIIKEMHAKGLVHGDIRDTNILVNHESLAKGTDDVQIHIIDFDWAGLVGVAKYPLGVNRKTIRRPDGAQGGALITEEHDEEMIANLFLESNPIELTSTCSITQPDSIIGSS